MNILHCRWLLKRLLNMMAEKAPDDARTAAALVSTPGLVPYLIVGSGPILAMNDDMAGRASISSAAPWRIACGSSRRRPAVDTLGGCRHRRRRLAALEQFRRPSRQARPPAWSASRRMPSPAGTCPADPLNQITDPDFPGASSVCYVDGYFAFSALGDTAQWFISRLLDPAAIDALDFVFSDATAERHPPGDRAPRSGLDDRRSRLRGLV